MAQRKLCTKFKEPIVSTRNKYAAVSLNLPNHEVLLCHFPGILFSFLFSTYCYLVVVLTMRFNWVHLHMCPKYLVAYNIKQKLLQWSSNFLFVPSAPLSFHICVWLPFSYYWEILKNLWVILLSYQYYILAS